MTTESILQRMRELVDEMESMETAQSQFQTGDLVSFDDGGDQLVGLVEAFDDETLTVRVQAQHGPEFEPTDDVRTVRYEDASSYSDIDEEPDEDAARENPDENATEQGHEENNMPEDPDDEEVPKGAWVVFNTEAGLTTGLVQSVANGKCTLEVYEPVEGLYEPTGVVLEHRMSDLRVRKDSPDVAPRKMMVKINDLVYDEDEKVGHIKGYASTYGNVDLGGDVVTKGAFTQTLFHKKNKVKLFLDHHYRVSDVAGIAHLTDDEKGLALDGELPIEIPSVKEVHDKIKFLIDRGEEMGLSIGYDIVKAKMRDDGVRELKEISLGEVSLTPFPMNTESTIYSAKARKIAYLSKKSIWQKIVPNTKKTDAPVGNQLSQDDVTSLVNETVTFIKNLNNNETRRTQVRVS